MTLWHGLVLWALVQVAAVALMARAGRVLGRRPDEGDDDMAGEMPAARPVVQGIRFPAGRGIG